ncbi:MAG: DUF5723 family protein [Lentimicrobiaceae bacterium]|nr:DUF5723 family protein [Lentimicrobiaceae bacterium]
MTNSNYAGSVGVIQNPSSMLTSKLYFDINLLSGGAFADNNYVYFSKNEYKFSRFLQANPSFPEHGETGDIVYDNYNKDLKSAYGNIRVMGPSAMVVSGKHAFAIYSGVRVGVSAHNAPYELAKFVFEELDAPEQFNVRYNDTKKFGFAAMAWGEVGVSYAYSVYEKRLDHVAAGITIKKLFGYSGGYIAGNNIDYMVPNADTIFIYNLNAKGGLSLPVDYGNNEYPGPGGLFRGSGWGFDLGFTYEKKLKEISNRHYSNLCAQKYVDYQYRLGVSLVDIGSIKFTQNARALSFDNVSHNWYEVSDLNYTDIDSTLIEFSNRFYGNPTQLVSGNSFKIFLPTALSVQFDYHLAANYYLNSSLYYGFQLNAASLHRSSQISVTPRYESRYLEASLPISLYEFSKPRIGLALRLGFLTLGSDKLGSFFNMNDFYGMDIYFAIKFNFSKGHCRDGGFNGCENNEFLRFRKKSRW